MTRTYRLSLIAAAALALAACNKKDEAPAAPAAPAAAPAAAPSEPAAAPAAAAPAAEGAAPAAPARTAAPAGTKIGFTGIKEGDTVASPVKFDFALEGAKIAPAGTADAGTGHFHVIVDSDLPPQDAPLPASDKVIHFGKGQTGAELTLAPGPHTLQLEFTDGNHLPFDPPVTSDKINITVK